MATATLPRKPRIVETEHGSHIEPMGRMTHPLITRYRRGDRVLLTADAGDLVQSDGAAKVGEVGTIRDIRICDPNDGDDTSLYFDVKVADGVVGVSESEIAPFKAVEAWLGRHLVGHALRKGRDT